MCIRDSTTIYQDSLAFTDDMTGSIMKGYFVDGRLDSIRLEGMATTIYHIFEDSIYQGKNQASGDTITMNFSENDIEKIFISGGSEGTYTPDSTGADVDGPVIYTSEDIEYDVKNEFTDLHGDATIDYTNVNLTAGFINVCLLYTSPSPRDGLLSRMPSSA